MIQQEPDVQLNGWVKAKPPRQPNFISAIIQIFTKTLVIAEMEVRKLRHDPTDLIVRAVQPSLWLLIFGQVFTKIRAIPTGIFGQVFTKIRAIPTGDLPYLDFMTAGILAQSVLFISIFTGGMTLIWERDLGVVHKFLASPTPRVAMVLGKSLACGVRCLSQVFVIYGLALVLGVKLNLHPLAFLQVLLVVMLGAGCFCTFSLIIGCLVKTRERMTGIGQLLTMPLFFASNAIYPISMMPDWLKFLSGVNPLTYEVDALRGTMLANGTSKLLCI